jgi:hypothetical protein
MHPKQFLTFALKPAGSQCSINKQKTVRVPTLLSNPSLWNQTSQQQRLKNTLFPPGKVNDKLLTNGKDRNDASITAGKNKRIVSLTVPFTAPFTVGLQYIGAVP